MKQALTDIPGIGESTAALLAEHGIGSVKALIKGGEKKLCKVPGFGEIRSANVLAAAEALNVGGKADKKSGKSAKSAKKSDKAKSAKKSDKKDKGKKGKKAKKSKK